MNLQITQLLAIHSFYAIKKAEHCRIVVLEKTLESPLDCKEIKPVNPKGNQHWIFTGRTDAEARGHYMYPYKTDMDEDLVQTCRGEGDGMMEAETEAM